MEKIKLNKEQEKKFMEKFMNGDIEGFIELENILKNELKIPKENIEDYDIYDLLGYIIALNGMVSCGEGMESQDLCNISSLYFETYDLYTKYKQLLFDLFENDFMKWYK